jgi:hypothetical protein
LDKIIYFIENINFKSSSLFYTLNKIFKVL